MLLNEIFLAQEGEVHDRVDSLLKSILRYIGEVWTQIVEDIHQKKFSAMSSASLKH